jgi:hypothetical protein
MALHCTFVGTIDSKNTLNSEPLLACDGKRRRTASLESARPYYLAGTLWSLNARSCVRKF